ncbi:MAG TPA: aminotransferase class V-fold PLP-dependent enzyme [bacterium]|nr:aminotransferase class V-fold PLP-dependent enzyme [bacterium]
MTPLRSLPAQDPLALWTLDPNVVYLNHGSFGACPLTILEAQTALRRELECEPIVFLDRHLEQMGDEARRALASLIGAQPDDLAFIENASTGVNTVLRSLVFSPDDELLTTNHEYNACRNALQFLADRWGCKIVVADIPFPLESPGQVVEAILARVTERTRLAMISHITSQTALVLPMKEIVDALQARQIDVLVDGAHVPGQLPLDVTTLGAAYYTGNCHKWLCTPKGSAFLWVRPDKQDAIRPLTISHGYNSTRTDLSRFRQLFDWTGTKDPTAVLVLPQAIEFLSNLLPGGINELMNRNHQMAIAQQRTICEALHIQPPCPDEMIAAMAAFPLPEATQPPAGHFDVLQNRLFAEFAVEIPIIYWPAHPRRLVRYSVQMYNTPEQYDYLAHALVALLSH